MPEIFHEQPEENLADLFEQSRLLRERAARVGRDAQVLAREVMDGMKRLDEKTKRFNELAPWKRKPLTV
jgi:hypothetical protein